MEARGDDRRDEPKRSERSNELDRGRKDARTVCVEQLDESLVLRLRDRRHRRGARRVNVATLLERDAAIGEHISGAVQAKLPVN